MPGRKPTPFPAGIKEVFTADWRLMKYKDMSKKYGVSKTVLVLWGKTIGMPFPKPLPPIPDYSSPVEKARLEIQRRLQDAKQAAQSIKQGQSPDGNTTELLDLAQQLKDAAYMDIPSDEKEQKSLDIIMKAYSLRATMQNMPEKIIEEMNELAKIILNKKRSTYGKKEDEKMSYEVLRNLKIKHLKEGLDDIEANLITESAKKMFNGLIGMATKHFLAERKKKEEVNVQKAIDNGIIDADTIDGG